MSTKSEITTPLTDEVINKFNADSREKDLDNFQFYQGLTEKLDEHARSLERRNAELTVEASGLRMALAIANRSADDQMFQKREAEKQVLELTARIAELEQSHRRQSENYVKLYDAVMGDGVRTSDFADPIEAAQALHAAVAEARKDGQRLDWLTTAGDHIYGQQYEGCEDHADGWEFEIGAGSDGSLVVNIYGHGKTIREAIDAAMLPEPKEGK